MAETDPNVLLGRLAVHFKLLDKAQVAAALNKWRESGQVVDFGVFLISEDILASQMVKKLLHARQKYMDREQASPAPEPAAPQPSAPEPAAPQPAAPVQAPESSDGLLQPEAPDEPLTFDGPQGPGPAAPQPSAPQPSAPEPAAPEPSVPVPAAPQPVAPEPSATQPAAPEPAPQAPPAQPAIEEEGGLHTPIDTTPPTPEELAAAYQTHPQFRLQLQQGITLRDLLHQTRQLNGSDLHVHSAARLKIRLHGQLIDTSGILAPSVTSQLVVELLTAEQRQQLEHRQQLDFSYDIPGVGRFRANAYMQQNGLDAVFRAIPPEPPTLAELGLPDYLTKLASFHQGMVLFTGPAGCGKSSTMAAMVRMINEQRPDHIITVEDPIEYVHRSQRCIVNQRQVGPHTGSFARALRGALREDPDIIVIGEMRDLETISLALTAAETGHLVLGTLHTSSAIRTINRLLGVFPPDQQAQIRTMVSESLRAVVSQRLVRRADGQGRTAALEVMINNKAVGNLIRENKTFQIHSAIQTGSRQGMVLLDSSLQQLVKDGVITKEEAQGQAEKPETFK